MTKIHRERCFNANNKPKYYRWYDYIFFDYQSRLSGTDGMKGKN